MNSTCADCPYLERRTECNLLYQYAPEDTDWYRAEVARCDYLDERREIMRIPYGEESESKIIESKELCDNAPRPSWCKLHGREDSHFMQRFMQKD